MTVGTVLEEGNDVRLAGNPKWWFTPPDDINMRLPDQVLNTVCFIAHSAPEIKYGGTAFVVAMKGSHGNAFLHLVTAKHVAEAVEHVPFVIGVNTKRGQKALLDANYDADHIVKWWYHPTEPNAVDVAVTMFGPDQYEKLDIEWVFYPNMFVTPEIRKKAGIGIGDEVAAVGLFTAFSGKDKHSPIVRIGNLAMLPEERVPVKGFDPMEVYLAESRSIGGLSGSPVYVRQTLSMDVKTHSGEMANLAGCGKIYFLGLMHGHWELPAGFVNSVPSEAINMGISIIVPAHKILEVLNHPELVEMRRKHDEEIGKETLAVQDSAFEKPGAKKPFTHDEFEAALKKASRKIERPKS